MQQNKLGKPTKGRPGSRSKDNTRTPNVSSWGSFAHQERGKGRRGKADRKYQNEERNTEENEIDPEQESNETDPESMEEHWDVNYTVNGDESLSDLDWREVENYGADRELGQFLRNNAGTQGY